MKDEVDRIKRLGYTWSDFAEVAELAYAYVSEAYGVTLEGSTPSLRTKLSGGTPSALKLECGGTPSALFSSNSAKLR